MSLCRPPSGDNLRTATGAYAIEPGQFPYCPICLREPGLPDRNRKCRDEDVRVDEDTTHELQAPHLVDECLDVVVILQARLVSGTCERCLDPCKGGQPSLCEHDLTVRPLKEEHLVARYKVQPAAHLGGDGDLTVGRKLGEVHAYSILEI